MARSKRAPPRDRPGRPTDNNADDRQPGGRGPGAVGPGTVGPGTVGLSPAMLQQLLAARGQVPTMQKGGLVPRTGLYKMHKGERVTPAMQKGTRSRTPKGR
jgi:hypothetical protein